SSLWVNHDQEDDCDGEHAEHFYHRHTSPADESHSAPEIYCAVHITLLGPTLGSMPYRNSGIDLAHGVVDKTVAVGVFAQPWPTAHRLAQCSWAGPLPSLGDGHIG